MPTTGGTSRCRVYYGADLIRAYPIPTPSADSKPRSYGGSNHRSTCKGMHPHPSGTASPSSAATTADHALGLSNASPGYSANTLGHYTRGVPFDEST
jgi:hypothetical protein